MRAALVTTAGEPPVLVEDRPEPDGGGAIVDVVTVALNPVDLAIASGSFPGGQPLLPYIPGIEAVGAIRSSNRFASGTRVYVCGGGLGVTRDGVLAERLVAPDEILIEVPGDTDDVTAVACGVAGLAAWMPLTWLAPVREGESVLILGATGSVGTIAVQAAKALGAGRVIAAGRDRDRLEQLQDLGADATVAIEADFEEKLSAALADGPPTLVLDALWGRPLEVALQVAGRGARIVHLGQSAGATATVSSGLVRGKQLQILGYSNFAVPHDALVHGYAALLEQVAAGRIIPQIEVLPFERIGEAWRRLAEGARGKVVLSLAELAASRATP